MERSKGDDQDLWHRTMVWQEAGLLHDADISLMQAILKSNSTVGRGGADESAAGDTSSDGAGVGTG